MIVLNDVELIMPLRSVGLLKDGLFGISQLYFSENYFETNEVIAIKELEKNGNLTIFDLSNDFFNFYNKNHALNPNIAVTDISSVYYAQKYKLTLVSRCKHVGKFASQYDVNICEPIEALKVINANKEQINILEYIMTSIMTN